MATPAPSFHLSLLPIFLDRLRTLKAIAPGLHELPPPLLDEVQAHLDQLERVVAEFMGEPASPGPESASLQQFRGPSATSEPTDLSA